MRIVVSMLMLLMPLAACGGDTESESEASTAPAAEVTKSESEASAAPAEEEVFLEDLEELMTDDEEAIQEGLELAAERSGNAAGAAVPIDVPPCDLVTTEEIEAATSYTVELMTDEPPMSCRFDLVAESDLGIWITADDAQGRLAGPAAIFQRHEDEGDASPFEEIENVGERALYAGRGLSVDAGEGRYIFVGVGGQYLELAEPLDQMIALAEIALTRL